MNRYVCIHGHFYQPPRENPWLETVEVEDSAHPYHDWNQRITTECYAANAAARILDGRGRIDRIANNYERISFNFGPTLLAWLETEAPETYAAVLAADQSSTRRFGGHGSAIAQGYNHVILPLANQTDRITQVRWGLADFRRRFGRDPEGMWLPETAVDLATLEVLAEHGIRFTVLAPHQAARVRRLGERDWRDVAGGRIDPTTAYRLALPSGRGIAAFFYDGPVAREVAFEKLLNDGGAFAGRLTSTFDDRRPWPQLAHIATDGETYGHHHRFGEMALAFALAAIEADARTRLTNYGQFLEIHPPQFEAEIVPLTSWSCAHGVERWRADCGCSSGMHVGWHQRWRRPLREALDWLRDALWPRFLARGGGLLRDPVAARDAYVEVLLDRTPERLSAFLERQASRPLDDAGRIATLQLLEMQRHALLMYTSCGWFFDEISGIETIQVLQYAGRAIQLARSLTGEDLEPPFLDRLALAPSNRADLADGRGVYERFVRPAMVDLRQVAAHVAVSSLFDGADGPRTPCGCYEVREEEQNVMEAGRLRLAVGTLHVGSPVTLEHVRVAFGVLHFGDHNIACGVRELPEQDYLAMLHEARTAFARADIPEVIRLLDRHFAALTYSLKSLFRDEQRRILDLILASTLAEAEAEYSQLVDHHAPLMRFLRSLEVPLPAAFRSAAELVFNTRLQRALDDDRLDLERIRGLLGQAEEYGAGLDAAGLAFALERALDRLASHLTAAPRDLGRLRDLLGAAGLAVTLPFDVNLWRLQNRVYALREEVLPERRAAAESNDAEAATWVESFGILAGLLRIGRA